MSEPSDHPRDERFKLVHEEALRAIEGQERTLDELRARVGAMLASTVIATAFFGGVGIRPGHLRGWQWAALSLFVLSALLQVGLLLPIPGWRFKRSPIRLIRDYVEAQNPASLDAMYRDLALNIWKDKESNDCRLKPMWWIFTAAALALVAEVVLWLLAIAHY
jgi:hypothetical protein